MSMTWQSCESATLDHMTSAQVKLFMSALMVRVASQINAIKGSWMLSVRRIRLVMGLNVSSKWMNLVVDGTLCDHNVRAVML